MAALDNGRTGVTRVLCAMRTFIGPNNDSDFVYTTRNGCMIASVIGYRAGKIGRTGDVMWNADIRQTNLIFCYLLGVHRAVYVSGFI
jgi:hypothetical protein